MKPLKILTIENPEEERILRTPSSDVPAKEISDPNIQQFFDQLILTLQEGVEDERLIGVGLSAVQVGKLVNVFVAFNTNTQKHDIYINPQIQLKGTATDTRDEVCLSIPDTIGSVERHKRLQMTWLDREEEQRKKEFTGFNARILQHEFDHLQGVLFIDKLVGKTRRI